MPEKGIEFDDILETVGSYGRFQRRFNFVFNFIFLIVVCMANLNFFLIMAVPSHWCHVPGRENTNYTLDGWKELTIPRKSSSSGNEYESCKMFVLTNETDAMGVPRISADNLEIIECQYGWDFDKTWYTLTIPMAHSWVCNKDIYVTNSFVFQRMGDVFGNLFFGHFGDTFGRYLIFYLTLSTLLFGRFLLLFSSFSTEFFMVACFIGGLAVSAVFQAPLVIALEISSRDTHAYIAMIQCVGWVISFCTIPLLMWILGDWMPFLLVTTLPCATFLFTCNHVIESPRWLFSKGKKAKCIKELKRIAKANKIDVGDDLELMVNKGHQEMEGTYGVMSLFSHWRLAKNTVILIMGWSFSNLIYYVLTLNIDNMGGNPFMNFFWQGLAELPGYILGKMSCDKYGRKWTTVISFLLVFIGSFPIIFLVNDPAYQWFTVASAIFLKFCISAAFYGANLQALEIYPTIIRQTGVSTGAVTANIIGMVGPYIVYLGTTINMAFPYAIASVFGLTTAFASLLLPETLNEKLPETMSEAHNFGKNQPFWFFPHLQTHKPVSDKDDER